MDPLLAETFASLAEPALITRNDWQGGGVEIVAANAAFCTLSGYDAASLAGNNTRLLHGPKTDLAAPGAWRNPNGSDAVTGEGWLHRRDGTAFYATWSFSPVRRPGQTDGLLLALFRDASETRRLQEALLHSQKLDTVGQLAGGVAHDFNNLLSIINGYCEIMSAKLAEVPAAQKDLQEIHRAGLKAAGIARQILEFSRRQETEARVVNANTLIREIADILRRVVGDAVKVELRLSSDLGNMRIDPTQFQQVLLNLCFNARDAMPQGGKLTLRTFSQVLDGGTRPLPAGLAPGVYVTLQIADTGAGMDENQQRRAFEPFFTTKLHGTGLGLPTVLGIVKRAGGGITVQSAPGRGTTFEVLLPETAEPEQLFSTTLAALPATRGSESVWLVEADAALRKMVAGILAVDGYRVQPLGATAEAPAGQTPDLLIIDNVSDAALALARRLREAQPRLCVLSLAVDSPASALPEFSANTVAHLPKPFALSTLLRAVRGLLDAGAH
jgi:two-component system cell cycle sensor histidine kinase/response regulator CckA